MDKYHIYEELGKGQYSQIFKGREKKSIEYVAIKRVDKNMMNNIVNEVQIMHRLNSPHIMKFHDWYETKNNLWLILEYCTCGDLQSLLKQDDHLPETSVRMFALDIISGLKYLHMLGYLHCDLRPCNILIDEYGILKLSDFKLTRKIPKVPLGSLPLSSRGTVLYMAPELFSSEGAHSFASDFWALGCILFELRMGAKPFSGRWWRAEAGGDGESDGRMVDVVDNIRSKEVSAIIQQMIVVKSGGAKGGGSGRGGRGRGGRGSASSKESSGRSSVTEEAGQDTCGYVPSMSRDLFDVLSWLLEKVPHHRCDWPKLCTHPFWETFTPSPPQLLPEQPAFEAMIRQFADESEEIVGVAIDAGSASDDLPGVQSSRVSDTSAQDECKLTGLGGLVQDASMSAASEYNYSTDDFEEEAEEGKTVGPSIGHAHLHSQRVGSGNHIAACVAAAAVSAREDSGSAEGLETTPFDPLTLLIHSSDSQVKPIVNNKAIEPIERFVFTKGGASSSLQFPPLSAHSLDDLDADKIEAHLALVYKAMQSSFGDSASASASVSLVTERMNLLSYLCSIASNAEVANTVLNTQFVSLLLHIIKTKPSKLHQPPSSPRATSATSVRSLAATALALFLRYATFIQSPVAFSQETHILAVLVDLLSDPERHRLDSLLRHRALAALGELVFYISAQDDEEVANEHPWVLPPATVTVLTKSLADDTDEVVRHYAAKIIENVLAQGSYPIRRRLGSWDIASRLFDLSQHSRNASIQAVSAMALFHLFHMMLRDLPQDRESFPDQSTAEGVAAGSRFVARVLEKGGLSGFIDALKDSRPRLQQAYLNIFNTVFAASHVAAPEAMTHRGATPSHSQSQSLAGDAALKPVRFYFVKSQGQLLPILSRLADQGGSSAVRGKATLAVELLCRFHPPVVIGLADCRFQHVLSKLLENDHDRRHGLARGEAKDEAGMQVSYVLRCAQSMRRYIRYLLVQSLQGLSAHLKNCTTMASPRVGTGPGGCYGEEGVDLSATNILDVQETNLAMGGGLYSTPSKSPAPTSQLKTPLSHHGMYSESPSTHKQNSRTSPHTGVTMGSATSAASKHTRAVGATTATSRMMDFSAIVRSCITMTSSPTLRRLVISPAYIDSLASALTLLSDIIRQPEWASRLADEGKDEAVSIAEQAVLLALESVAQVDPSGDDCVDSPSSFDDDSLRVLMTNLMPSAVQFCGNCDGDARVIVMFVLRKLLPPLASCYHRNAALHECFTDRVLQALPLSVLLLDNPPIPQYAVRLLSEVAVISDECCVDIAQSLWSERRVVGGGGMSRNLLKELLDLLQGERTRDSSGDSAPAGGEYMQADPQVAVLLRCLMNNARGDAQRDLIEAGLADAIVSCCMTAMRSGNADMLVLILDLLNSSLRYVDLARGRSEMPQVEVRGLMKTAISLSRVVPQLLEISTWRVSASEGASEFNGGKPQRQSLDSALLFVLQDSTIRALTQLVHLHAEAVVDGLGGGKWCVAKALANPDLDWRLMGKYLSVILSVTETSVGKQRSTELKRAVMTSDVVQFLRSNCASSKSRQDAIDSIETICSKLLVAFDLY